MKIVFMGSPDFAIPTLDRLYESEHEITAVVSNVDKRRGRGKKKSPTPVKARAQDLNIPVIEVDDLRAPSFAKELKQLDADLFVVVAFRILPPEILEIPHKGSVNLHASLLPKYRGAAPIHWAIIKGEKETGCTIFFLNEQVDAGVIIKQEKTAIGPNETTGEVYNRLKDMGSKLMVEAVNEIEHETHQAIEQNDSEACPAPKLFTDDCRVDFNQTAEKVHNKIRGLSPFPTAWAKLDGEKFNIYRSKIGPDIQLPTGELKMVDDQLLAGCGKGTVELVEVQLQGKKKMSGKDFMNGYNGKGQLK